MASHSLECRRYHSANITLLTTIGVNGGSCACMTPIGVNGVYSVYLILPDVSRSSSTSGDAHNIIHTYTHHIFYTHTLVHTSHTCTYTHIRVHTHHIPYTHTCAHTSHTLHSHTCTHITYTHKNLAIPILGLNIVIFIDSQY